MLRTTTCLTLSLLTLALSSCVTKYDYVVRDSAPGSVITVLPETMAGSDVDAADHIVSVLLACGANVVERPVMLKERSDYSSSGSGVGVGVTNSGGLAIVSGEAGRTSELKTSVDPVALISETKADYVFIVRKRESQPTFRVVKKETGQILYAGSFEDEVNPACCLTWWAPSSSEEDKARKLLYRIGVFR